MSKGSQARPYSIPRDQFDAQHEAIFGKRERKQWVPPPLPCAHKTLSTRSDDPVDTLRCVDCGAKLKWVALRSGRNLEIDKDSKP